MKTKIGPTLIVILLTTTVLLVGASVVCGQGYDKERDRNRAQKSYHAIELQPLTVALGFGSFFAEESVTFSSEALYGAFQYHGVGFPGLEPGTSTGMILEAHPATLFTGGNISTVDYRVWSMNRVPMSAVPLGVFQSGTLSRTFSGVDALIYEVGDYSGGFDARLVLGGDLGVLGPGNLVVELYFFQRDVPIAFALVWGV